MPRLKFTDQFVRHIKSSSGERLEFLDTLVPQLMLRVNRRGNHWALLARYPGYTHPTRRALGSVFAGDKSRLGAPDPEIYDRHGAALSLAEAREKARRWLVLISRGIDPGAARRQAADVALAAEAEAKRAAESTFQAVGREWLKRHASQLKHWKEAKSIVENDFIKRWGERPIASITMPEAAEVIRAVAERGKYQGHAAYGYLRQVFNFAIGSGEFDITASPFAALRQKDVLGEKLARDRVLDDAELRAVWDASLEMGYPWGDCVRLLILTGQRLREIADLPWEEVDLGQRLITIPAERMKGRRAARRAHEVPLASQAMALLEAVPPGPEGRGFVFSSSGGKRHIAGFGRAKAQLDKASGVGDWVLHDLRRTMRTRLSALNIEDRVREAMIAHAAPGLHQVYDQHRYFDEKRRGFELWEARLSQILSPGGKVVTLRGPR